MSVIKIYDAHCEWNQKYLIYDAVILFELRVKIFIDKNLSSEQG